MRNNAGYEIIKAIEFPNNTEVVLGIGQHDYVTWICKDKNNYFWGHYIPYEIDAKIDFFERVQKEAQYYIDLYESRRVPWGDKNEEH